MYGDNSAAQIQDDTVVQPLDPSVMADPAVQQVAAPVYADDSSSSSTVQQMHQDAVAASQAVSGVDTATTPQDDELLAIKQEALTALTPLVGNLDQSPEDKFRTTMMLIQASDDRTLVRQAYEAAQAISDEKVKAQALLDVVNEINYFVSHSA
jgi:hypothetical protein